MALSGPNRNDPVGSTITGRRRRVDPTNPQDMEQGTSNNPVDLESALSGSRMLSRRGQDMPMRRPAPAGRRVADSGPSADALNQAFLDKLSRQRMEDEGAGMPIRRPAAAPAMSAAMDLGSGGGGMKKGGRVHSDAASDRKFMRSEYQKLEKSEPAGMKKGGLVSRGDGKAMRGKTKGRYC